MAAPQTFSKDVIKELSIEEPPELDIYKVVTSRSITWPPSLLKEPWAKTTASPGHLNKFPPELLTNILNFLDFPALANLSCTSRAALVTVANLRAYQAVMANAPQAVITLKERRVLKDVAVSTLDKILQSDECVSCLGFGVFLYLPTLERVCNICLERNCGLGLTTDMAIRRCFWLTLEQCNEAICLVGRDASKLKGEYANRRFSGISRGGGASARFGPIDIFARWDGGGGGGGVSGDAITPLFEPNSDVVHFTPRPMVSVKEAKKLALKVHGSKKKFYEFLSKLETGDGNSQCAPLYEAPLGQLDVDPLTLPVHYFVQKDEDGRDFSSVRFPALTKQVKDSGRACKGCKILLERWIKCELPASVVTSIATDLVPGNDRPRRSTIQDVLQALQNKLHSEEGFLDHISRCYGVQQLLNE